MKIKNNYKSPLIAFAYLFLAVIAIGIVVYIVIQCIRPEKEYFESTREIPHHIVKKQTNNNSTIPHTVFQTWNTRNIPNHMYETIMNNVNENPTYDFYIFNDEECRDFIKQHFDEAVLMAFDTLKPGAYKADLWRLCVLYIHGGIYIDIKFKINKPLTSFLNDSAFVQDLGEDAIYQGFVISKKGEPILKEGIDKIVENVKNKYYGINFLSVTGPLMLGPIVKRTNNSLIKFKLVVVSDEKHTIIAYNDNETYLSEYPEYRAEQKSNGTKHYRKMYDSRDIYN